MNMDILTEGRNFKTFVKENYAIALDSCYLFTEKRLSIEPNMILVVPMDSVNIRHSGTLQQI